MPHFSLGFCHQFFERVDIKPILEDVCGYLILCIIHPTSTLCLCFEAINMCLDQNIWISLTSLVI